MAPATVARRYALKKFCLEARSIVAGSWKNSRSNVRRSGAGSVGAPDASGAGDVELSSKHPVTESVRAVRATSVVVVRAMRSMGNPPWESGSFVLPVPLCTRRATSSARRPIVSKSLRRGRLGPGPTDGARRCAPTDP